ncbi:MAG: hypothetical protein R3C40_07360 [Parvularculaceae bacterium]
MFYLHALKENFDAMLARENRTEYANACFHFLPTRCLRPRRLERGGHLAHS